MQESGCGESAESHAHATTLPHLAPSKNVPIAGTALTAINRNGEVANNKPSLNKMLNQRKTSAELLISGKTTYVPEDGLRYNLFIFLCIGCLFRS